MIVLECANCGAQYPADLRKHWGKTKETSGYGPQMQCVAMVPNGLRAPNGEEAKEVCGGMLAAITTDKAERAVSLTPIEG